MDSNSFASMTPASSLDEDLILNFDPQEPAIDPGPTSEQLGSQHIHSGPGQPSHMLAGQEDRTLIERPPQAPTNRQKRPLEVLDIHNHDYHPRSFVPSLESERPPFGRIKYSSRWPKSTLLPSPDGALEAVRQDDTEPDEAGLSHSMTRKTTPPVEETTVTDPVIGPYFDMEKYEGDLAESASKQDSGSLKNASVAPSYQRSRDGPFRFFRFPRPPIEVSVCERPPLSPYRLSASDEPTAPLSLAEEVPVEASFPLTGAYLELSPQGVPLTVAGFPTLASLKPKSSQNDIPGPSPSPPQANVERQAIPPNAPRLPNRKIPVPTTKTPPKTVTESIPIYPDPPVLGTATFTNRSKMILYDTLKPERLPEAIQCYRNTVCEKEDELLRVIESWVRFLAGEVSQPLPHPTEIRKHLYFQARQKIFKTHPDLHADGIVYKDDNLNALNKGFSKSGKPGPTSDAARQLVYLTNGLLYCKETPSEGSNPDALTACCQVAAIEWQLLILNQWIAWYTHLDRSSLHPLSDRDSGTVDAQAFYQPHGDRRHTDPIGDHLSVIPPAGSGALVQRAATFPSAVNAGGHHRFGIDPRSVGALGLQPQVFPSEFGWNRTALGTSGFDHTGRAAGSSNDKVASPPLTKRPRGRPRKAADPEADPVPLKRPRGRPRKRDRAEAEAYPPEADTALTADGSLGTFPAEVQYGPFGGDEDVLGGEYAGRSLKYVFEAQAYVSWSDSDEDKGKNKEDDSDVMFE